MAERVRRRNEPALRWVRATAFGALVWAALAGLGFTPPVAIPVLAAAVAVTALFAPGIAVLAALGVLSLPVLAGDLVTGVVLLVIGFASVQYLAQGKGQTFLIIASALILAWAGPVWAAAALAGLLLGASEGAVTALLACLAVQAAAIVAGEPHAGLVFSGATTAGTVSPAALPDNILTFSWIADAVSGLSPEPLITAFTGVREVPLLLLQPLAWAAGAATGGLLRRKPDDLGRPWISMVAVVAAVAVTGVLHTGLLALRDGMPPASDLVIAGGSSMLIALAVAGVREWVFPPLPCVARPVRSSLHGEDADVDELLSLIAQAEDELVTKHTAEATVMITDMKSFSVMTEEDGSVTSAKAIQRHRDLLIPLIEQAGGNGKSTGGDGLVAAFPDPGSAVRTAVLMQRALADHNRAHPAERDISIRIGIASGEVVLDKRGRPFIGTALNLSARIMNLGDGGQILVARHVSAGARHTGAKTFSHGVFELKNIAGPAEVDEVLWADDQTPSPPRCE